MASAIPGTPMQTPALKFCILAALVPASLSFQSFAQAPAPGAAPAAAYADEPLVIERSETVVDVAADGTGWKQRTLVAAAGRRRGEAVQRADHTLCGQLAARGDCVRTGDPCGRNGGGDAAGGGDGHAGGGDARDAFL